MTAPRPTSQVEIATGDGGVVHGDLAVPDDATGIVVFVHGSGSSRHSSRNRHVASLLNDRGHATLLMDLLTEEEDAVDVRTREYRFDIPLLARRTESAVDHVTSDDGLADLGVGLFGASTGAAAALIAAGHRRDVVRAVVSRGGRPDLAEAVLGEVKAPVLLIVGGNDPQVIELNRHAASRLDIAICELEIVPGATHLFEEPGALDRVAELAGGWFDVHLARSVADDEPAAG